MQNHNFHLQRIRNGTRKQREAGKHVEQCCKRPQKHAVNLYVVAARSVTEDDASAKWLPYSALLFANVAGFAMNDSYANLVSSY